MSHFVKCGDQFQCRRYTTYLAMANLAVIKQLSSVPQQLSLLKLVTH